MSNQMLDKIADRLREAEQQGRPCGPVRDLIPGMTAEQAYQIQALNVAKRVSKGARIVGRKIGLTAKAVQKQLGVNEPDFGTLMDDMVLGNGDALSSGRLLQPKAEAEIALVLENDLSMENPTIIDVLRSVAFCMPAIEVVDSRIRDWDIKLVDTVADNGSSAFIVLGGDPYSLVGRDLRAVKMQLRVNDEERSTGVGAACLGHPLNAAAWLARVMKKLGTPLKAGDVIMTGALGPMAALKLNDVVRADFAGMGEVHLSVGA